MSETPGERLYHSLPAVYRARDVAQGEPLRALLGVIEHELESLESDVEGLYDNWFIETCADWVVPYLGDLLSARGLLPLRDGASGQRALVANTLSYRRRKGTAAMLEQLASDITGWPAKAVEFFELLATTQHLNHLRPEKGGTVDLRDPARLELIGGPFERTAHTAEVRHIDNARGRYNPSHAGLFLWRLQSFAVARGNPRAVADPADGRYTFASLGHDAPLFTRPRTETEITQLAEEVNLPGPIRPSAFISDLEDYSDRYRRAAPGDLPSESTYYGPNRSLTIVKDGEVVPAADVIQKDLSGWDRPPAMVAGAMSGPLSPFPSLTSQTPMVGVTVGSDGPHPATLTEVPDDLPGTASLLQDAIRAAHDSPAFAGARVAVVGDRLLVVAGTRGAGVVFSAAPDDETTVEELALDEGTAQQAHGVMSGPLSPFPSLTSQTPMVGVTVGSDGPHPATFDQKPGSLAQARGLLEEAIRTADGGPAFAEVAVAVAGDRLLVVAGDPGETVSFGPTDADHTTSLELGLSNKVAVDVGRGRLVFALGDEPKEEVTVSYNYGSGADVGGGPYDRRRRGPYPGDPEEDDPDTIANPNALDGLITVPSRGVDTVGEALQAWADAGKPSAVIQIQDNRTYQEDLAIDLEAGSELVIQAANNQRPTLIGDVTVTGDADETRFGLDGLLVSGGLHAGGRLGHLSIRHCTLVPGRRLDVDRRPQDPYLPSVVVEAARSRLEIDRSIVGPLRVPARSAGLEVHDSVVDSPLRGGRAKVVPALISKNLPSLNLTSEKPAVDVTIGDEGPYTATFPEGQTGPTTAFQALGPLQNAIRAAHDSPAFREARVIRVPDMDHLILLPGVPAPVTVEAAEGDPTTAGELGLDAASARRTYALIGGPLTSISGLSSEAPSLEVTIGDEGPRTIALAGDPETVVQARNSLQGAIRAVPGASPAFTSALVGNVEERLVVLPGSPGVAATFGVASSDRTTLAELALESDRPAIAATDGGEVPGPPTTLERTTVLGAVHVEELVVASEVIFAAPVTADRRQEGCVRFSYVPDGSRTPQRFRCQPDFEVRSRMDAALKADPPMTQAERDRVERDIRARLEPSFASLRYGEPGYAQLGPACAEELRNGAEDEDEMGVFNLSQRERRIRNLRASLDEYLRFGLEAGALPVT